MRKRRFEISRLFCPVCENKFPIPRRKDKRRKNGHKKDIWCPYCKEVKTMIEIKDGELKEVYRV